MRIGISKVKAVRTAFHVLTALFLLCAESGCSYAQDSKGKATKTKAKKGFTLPEIPQVLTGPEERAEYLAAHYWDNFDFTDTTLISKPEITEQALVDFLNILPHVQIEKSRKALTGLMEYASSDSLMLIHFMELAEKYLYDPNSPMRNEEFYIPILNYIVSSPKLDETQKVRPQFQLERAMKNRPGEIAADFSYTLSDGSVAKMSSIKADYTILYFNNPDCGDCKRVKDYIKHSEVFSRMAKVNSIPSLRILAVYPDADIPLWKRGDYPKLMINGFDAGQVITNQKLYDLKAIPALYLLDADKRVILKDASVEQIEAWLRAILHNR